MRIPTQECPETLQLHNSDSLRLCGKTNGASCDSIIIPIDNSSSYSRVRGRVRAYQYGGPDGFSGAGSRSMPRRSGGRNRQIDGNYVDGISITRGSDTRQHVWTYAVGVHQYIRNDNSERTCPSTGIGRRQPGFVGDNYFCSSGNPDSRPSAKLYTTPLWSNVKGNCYDCGDDDLFFCVELPESTIDDHDLEVRICTNQSLEKRIFVSN